MKSLLFITLAKLFNVFFIYLKLLRFKDIQYHHTFIFKTRLAQ